MIVPLTPLEFLFRARSLFPNKVGVVDGSHRFTYAQYAARCFQLSHALLGLGLRRDQRVAIMAGNSHPLLEAYYGVVAAGGVLLPLNIRLGDREIATILQHSAASFLLVESQYAPLVRAIWPQLTVKPHLIWIGQRPAQRGEPEYQALLQDAPEHPPPPLDLDENDLAELFYTSGTTGAPRGVMLTHRNLYLHAMSMMITFGCAESDVQLHTIPLFHVNGWGTPQGITAVGGTHVLLRSFSPDQVLHLLQKEKVTRFFAVPTMLNMLLNHPGIGDYDLSSLRLINTGGAATPPDMIRRAQQLFGCAVIGGYGLSETSPIISFAADKSYLEESEQQQIERRSRTGLPLVGTTLAIVDQNDRELPWDDCSVGEIVVRSNVVCAGYLDDDAATQQAMRNGWFHTGDLATVDSEGYLRIVDRKKDIIISGGENVSSVEIEKILYAHPAVLECAVVAAADERWGEVPAVYVVLQPQVTVSAGQLEDYCREQMASFKVPKLYKFVEELPKSGTGKVLKRLLRGNP